ncbi:hypothetical protein ACYCCC_22940 [Klebsiella pneumoniae]
MDTKKEEQYIIDVLKMLNLKATKIPEIDIPTPDFKIDDGEFIYLAELKTKFENNDIIKKRKERLISSNDIYSCHIETVPTSANNNIINLSRDATKQLNSAFQNNESDFKILILLCQGIGSQQFYEQFINSLYGRVKIYAKGKDSIPVYDCYYYKNSAFHYHRKTIDGAIIIGDNCATLCINDLSPRYINFKNTPLVRKFHTGIIDPIDKEASKKNLTIRESMDRNNIPAVNKHLEAKYGFRYVTELPMPLIRVISKVNK